MAIAILMPALSPTMTEGNIARWLKEEGDAVKPGDVIAEIETDKAVMEVEAVDSGIVARVLVPESAQGVKVNQLIAVLSEDGDEKNAVEDVIKKHGSLQAAPIQKHDRKNDEEKGLHTVPAPERGRVFASPLAKRIAMLENIDLHQIKGTGPHGRIIKADLQTSVQNYHDAPRPQEGFLLEPLSQIRKVIAKRLVEAKQDIPHFYMTVDCRLCELLNLRKQINDLAPKTSEGMPAYKISINDFIIKAAALTLRDVPEVNASYSDHAIKRYTNIDISVAVAIDDGLITPIVRNADGRPLSCISNEMVELTRRAKAHQLKPEEFQGGGFSITNLGMFGIKHFNAIVNPPQSAILAIGACEERPVIIDGQIKGANVISVTMSCDHRVIDGALGARFLARFKQFLETPGLMLT